MKDLPLIIYCSMCENLLCVEFLGRFVKLIGYIANNSNKRKVKILQNLISI